MPTPAIVLNLLFFPAIIASSVIFIWVTRKTKKAGIWPTEKCFGFERLKPLQTLVVIKLLRQLIQDTEDAVEAKQYRRWLNAIFLSYGLGFFALAILSSTLAEQKTNRRATIVRCPLASPPPPHSNSHSAAGVAQWAWSRRSLCVQRGCLLAAKRPINGIGLRRGGLLVL